MALGIRLLKMPVLIYTGLVWLGIGASRNKIALEIVLAWSI